MQYYVNAKARRSGDGSAERPFKTITEASNLAKPGDEVLVFPGVYREYVDPKCGGTEDKRIVYRSIKPREAIITGAERVKNWKPYQKDVWLSVIPNGIFGSYNPYTTKVWGDWYLSDVKALPF